MPLVALKPTQTIVDIVGALGGTWHGYNAMCRCPAHADSDPSLSIRQGHDGILVHCFAGCTAEDVLREIARIRPGRTYDPPAEQRTGRAVCVGVGQQQPALFAGVHGDLRGSGYCSRDRSEEHPPRCGAWLGGLG